MNATAPVADWVDTDELFRDPYPTYRTLREHAPVSFVPHLDRYFVTTFRECFDIEMDQETFSSAERAERSTMIRSMGRPLLRKDDPQHKAERNSMAPAMRPLAIKRRWLPIFERNAQTHIRRLRAAGPGADLFEMFAVPFAADNLSAVIGFDDVDHAQMMDWSHTLIAGVGNVTNDSALWSAADRACVEIDDAIDRALARTREDPIPSLISAMASALAPDDLRANIRLAISGGLNEPSHVIASAVWCLTNYPEQREIVLSDGGLWRDVFEETARFHSPVGMYPRTTTRDVAVRGYDIPAGSTVAVVVASANRDAQAFDRPDEFLMNREAGTHLAFGNGTHVCAGNWIARSMVGEVALPALYRALPGLIAERTDDAQFRGWVFRGTTSLPVIWHESAAKEIA